MRSRFLCFTCLFAMASVSIVRAQTGPDFQSSAPSPDDAALMKSVQSNMNYYDGTMNIQIPLYTLSEFGLQLPIQLRYKTSGIKIEDTASSVGLGWELSAGGKITRIVKRNVDELEHGFGSESLTNPEQVFKSYYGNNKSETEYLAQRLSGSSLWDKRAKEIDREPDLFYFEIPGYSGMFICDNGGNVHTIPYQNIDIRWVNRSYFVIRDPAGVKYTLGEDNSLRETAIYDNGDKKIKYTSSWLLNRMEDQFGNQINLYYRSGQKVSIVNYREEYTFYVKDERGQTESVTDPKKEDYEKKTKNTTMSIEDPKYLSSIRGQSSSLTFVTGGRNDLLNALKYNTIEIASTTGREMSIRFNHSQFHNGALRLDALYTHDDTGREKEKIVSFQYCTSPNLPARNSKDFDHWGYYNGKGNSTLFPSYQQGRFKFTGADHTPALYYTQANTLQRIDFGSGGYTHIMYELNAINEGNSTIPMGGLRVKQITESDGQKSSTKSLHYTTSVSGGQSTGLRAGEEPIYFYTSSDIVTPGRLPFLVLSHRNDEVFNMRGNSTEYYKVSEKLPNGSYNVYEYLTNNDESSKDEKGTNYVWNSSYTAVVPVVEQTDRSRIKAIMSSRFWRRGLLRKSEHYDANNNLINSVINNYSFGSPKAAVQGYIPDKGSLFTETMVGFRPSLYSYFWYSEPVLLRETITEAGPYNTRSVVQYEYDTTYMVPRVIRATDGLGNETVKRISYPFNYTISASSSQPTQYSLELLKERKIIVPVETVFTKNGRVVQGEYTTFKPIIGKKTGLPERYAIVPERKWLLALESPIDEADFAYIHVSSNQSIVADRRYRWHANFSHYNPEGQVLTYNGVDGVHKAFIYDPWGYPMAEIDNARASVPLGGQIARTNQVFYTGFENNGDGGLSTSRAKKGYRVYSGSYQIDLRNFTVGTYLLTYWKSTNQGQTWTKVTENVQVTSGSTAHTIGGNYYLDEVRMMPHGALMTTYTWMHGAGKTSETDPNGVSTYYEYDKFNRLIRVLDNDRNPIKSYEYNFKNN